jgi:bifunctional non-homologous end joining protein LigD
MLRSDAPSRDRNSNSSDGSRRCPPEVVTARHGFRMLAGACDEQDGHALAGVAGKTIDFFVRLSGKRRAFAGYSSKGPQPLSTRELEDLLSMYPAVATHARQLKVEQAVIDGEIVAVDKQGRPSFQALQHRGSHPDHTIVFYAFDLLHLDGGDLRTLPLEARQAELARIVTASGLLLSIQLPGNVTDIVNTVRAMQLEGVVAKRKDSPYEAGERSKNWQKLKLERQQEFVIGGYRPAGGNSVDALLVGFFEDRKLRFAAKVRAGLVPHVRLELARKLKQLQQDRCPFADLPTEGSSRWGGGVSAEDMKEMIWSKPELVVQIQFVEWTAEGRLRHSKFLGLRSDKAAKDVHRER